MKVDGKPACRFSSSMRLVGEVSGGTYIGSQVFSLAFHYPEYFRLEQGLTSSETQPHSQVEEEIGAWIYMRIVAYSLFRWTLRRGGPPFS
jgi:hypothetical protein